jgi:hypothetical protein
VITDTTLVGGSLTLRTPLSPGSRLAFRLDVTAADSLTVILPPLQEFVAPAWVTLLNLDDPSGLSIRDERPTFKWESPSISSPPGPFVYEVSIVRAEDDSVVASGSGLISNSFTPSDPLERNTPYSWNVEALAGGLGSKVFSRGTFVIIDDTAPFETLLFQNFPNPFPNLSQGEFNTCFWFDLAAPGPVNLDILDIRGHRIRNLVPGTGFPQTLNVGRYGRPASIDPTRCDPRLEWDGTTENGQPLPRGVYLAVFRTARETLVKRIVFLGN